MKTFAGMYKTALGVVVAAETVDFASKAPWVIGESSNAWPWTYFDLLKMCGNLVYVVQAYRYVAVANGGDEDDDAK